MTAPGSASPEERIKELARKNAIAPAEAARLLDSLRPAAVASGKTFDPFTRWSGERCALLGLVGVAIALGLSRFGLRGDGALDLHVSGKAVPFATALWEQAVDYLVTTIVLWGVARPFAAKVRLIDLLGTIGLARVPLMVSAIPMTLVEFGQDHKANPTVFGWIAIAIGLAGWGLQIWLLVLGFRTATAFRGGKLAAVFVGGLFAAETVTKLVLHFVHI